LKSADNIRVVGNHFITNKFVGFGNDFNLEVHSDIRLFLLILSISIPMPVIKAQIRPNEI
jgi:hypothetical protein